ncbi:MAG: flavodoxin family protein [Solirubrobacterales bacterium]
MKALFINCTLKPSPEKSNSEALGRVVSEALEDENVSTEWVRAVDLKIKPGVETDMGDGDEWPAVHDKLTTAEILVIVAPTWLGQPSSISKLVLERMDAMIAETDDDGVPVAYNRIAGVVVTGNEDGAHHVIAEICGALNDIGYTCPGQNWTYWNKGPGPGDDYLDTRHGHPWSESTGKAAASNLLAAAKALKANPIPAPPSS